MSNPHMAHLAVVAWANGGILGRADLRRADLRGVHLRRADLRGVHLRRADLRGVNLRDADLRGVNLGGVNLGGANLWGADLRGADLRGANLWGADLRGADLRGVNLRGADLWGVNLGGVNLWGAKYGDDTLDARIAAAERMDGYTFHLFRLEDGSHKVMAGCRWFTIDDYRAHVASEYPGTDRARETLDILHYFERRLA